MSRDAIRYIAVNGADVAYQISGGGQRDLLYIPGMLNHLESATSVPEISAHHERLASFTRVLMYDKRGTGLSEPFAGEVPTIEDRVDEALAVLDAADSDAASIYATADGGPVGIVLAAMYPDRVQQLIVYGSSARLRETEGYHPGRPPDFNRVDELEGRTRPSVQASSAGSARPAPYVGWGDDDDPMDIDVILPSQANDPTVRRALAAMQRRAGSPRAARRYWHVVINTDVRHVLQTVYAPTLVLHVRGDRLFPVAHGRYVAHTIPHARLVEIDGEDHFYFWENADRVADEIETFVTGSRTPRSSNRSFAILLITDIVGSTGRLVSVGDEAWRRQLESHDQLVGSIVVQYGGRVVDSTGDGVLAAFDGPSRAARCARRLVDALSDQGLSIRAGLHAGEVESRGSNVAGIAVHIAARVCALAGANEVLSTGTLRDLTAGSGISFRDRGNQELRGVPGAWSLFEVLP